MKKEGLLYDVKSGGFLHVYRDNSGKLIIDKQPCRHKHSTPMVVLAE
jgi:hypothetical protein